MSDNSPSTSTAIQPIQPVTIENEMERSYLDYAMSVIVSRALPDVRDGLKPVHRRILFAMKESGYDSTKPTRKSARIVGDVMGKYHPHGDAAIYDAMVRMAQDFAMRLPLIDGQGNFGSMDGDPPAAMRYTEARLGKAAETILADIDRDTIDFQPNYDDTGREPSVLPARFPNLLVNGAGGIAVGMATNIPPHNLSEVCDAFIALISNPDLSPEELLEFVPGPDFPTGGIIIGRSGIRSAAHTGRGSILIRARTSIEEVRKDRPAIIVNEIPYQVNKVRLLERIAECVREKTVEGIADLRDESNREGVRIVIELKRDAQADVVLNQLFRHTPLQTSFGVNMLALDGGRPVMMNIKKMLTAFIAFREQVITRRTAFELRAARARAHVLLGLAIAVANLDEMIALIRQAADPAVAKERLLAKAWNAADIAPLVVLVDAKKSIDDSGKIFLTDIQAKAILDLRLHRLTGLERDKIAADLRAVVENIKDYLDILANRDRVRSIMVDEISAIRTAFANPRRTTIEDAESDTDIEDLIQREEMVVTVSHAGYVKRVPLVTYRAQKRGGKGRSGMATREEDFVQEIFIASTHTPVLFFSSTGKVYRMKVYKLPLGNPQARGKALVNLLPLEAAETITTVMPLPEDEASWDSLHVVFATASGTIRRNRLSDFSNVRANGLIAMKLEDGDKLIAVQTCSETDDIALSTRSGKIIRFPVTDVRVFSGRTSVGVRGIRLAEGDVVIALSILRHVEATADERAAYLRDAASRRRVLDTENGAENSGDDIEIEPDGEEEESSIVLSAERIAELAEMEQFLLTVTERGFGKRSSSYDYRLAGRGGQGIWGIASSDRNGAVIATFPVRNNDEIMLVTDTGQVIRMPIADIRIAGRRTQGVTLFRIDADARVASVAVLNETSAEGEDGVSLGD